MIERVSIKKYISFVKGKAPKETFDSPAVGLVPYLSPEYLRGTGNPLYVEPNDKLVSVDEGELIVLWDGSNAGEIFVSKKGILGSTMTKILLDENEFEKKYFTYALKNNEYFLKAKTAGSGIPHVDKKIVQTIEVFKPQLSEQNSISSILRGVDEAISTTQNSIAKAEQLKKTLTQSLFDGKLKPDGTWRGDNEFYKDEKLGNVPNGWQAKKWGELIKLEYGKSLSSKEGKIPVFGTNGQIGFTERPLCCNAGIIVGRKGEYREIHYSSEPFWVIDTAFYIVPKVDFHLKWAFYSLKRVDINRFDSGSAIPSTNKKDVYHLRTLVPDSIEEQKKISEKIEAIEKIIEAKKNKIIKAQRLKKALMQNLLTGKIRPKQMEMNLSTSFIKP